MQVYRNTIIFVTMVLVILFHQNCTQVHFNSDLANLSSRDTGVPTLEGNGEPYEGKLYYVDAKGACGANVTFKSVIRFDGARYWLIKQDCIEISPFQIPPEEVSLVPDTDAIVYQGETFVGLPPEQISFANFMSNTSTYLSRTPSQKGNARVWTWSAWVKRSQFGDKETVFSVNSNNGFEVFFDSGSEANRLRVSQNGGSDFNLITRARYTNPDIWLHVVLQVDTTQSINADRVKLYVDGVQISDFANMKYPNINSELAVNQQVAHEVGRRVNGSDRHLNGFLAEMIFVDGAIRSPSDFGQSTTAGVWVHKTYIRTFGANGYHLKFGDPLGEDSSGNNNHFTSFGF